MRRPALLVSCALLVAAGCDGEPTAAPSPSPQASPMEETPTPEETATECQDLTTEEEVELQMSDNVFSPACIVSLGGQKVELENEGLNRHNFSIEGTKVDIDVEPDANASPGLVAELAEPGTHQFFCKYHRSLGMEGEITIVEAG